MRYTMQTDKEGKYVSQLLAPGMYQVIRVDGTDTSKVKVKFATVKSGETLVVDFGEATGCRVHGTVSDRGSPVHNCQVVLIQRGESPSNQKDLGVSTTNEKGQYELPVPRGRLQLYVEAAGREPVHASVMISDTAGPKEVLIEMHPGAEAK